MSKLYSYLSPGCLLSLSSLPPSLLLSPLSLQSLTQAEPMQQKQIIGEHLYRQIYAIHPELSGKITGTLVVCIRDLQCYKYTHENKCCEVGDLFDIGRGKVSIDLNVITHVTKCETASGRKARYYTAILSGKNDFGLWSVSMAEQFASCFLTSAESDFTFTPRMHKVSTGPNAH